MYRRSIGPILTVVLQVVNWACLGVARQGLGRWGARHGSFAALGVATPEEWEDAFRTWVPGRPNQPAGSRLMRVSGIIDPGTSERPGTSNRV